MKHVHIFSGDIYEQKIKLTFYSGLKGVDILNTD